MVVIGGGAKGNVWRQIMADMYNMSILKPQYLEEATSMGAAIIGGVGVGVFDSFDVIDKFNKIESIQKPIESNKKLYETMMPVFDEAYENALEPYLEEQIPVKEALSRAAVPFRGFMLGQTRDDDLMLFADISGSGEFETSDDVPFSLLMPAFVTSELKTAFQIGFLILIPFLVIDLVVATLLMSMGMMMLSPMIISLPFKIMLFVLIDGWSLIMGTLAASFSV